MRRFLITIEYVGLNYNGFQLQKVEPLKTVQGVLENALSKVFLTEVKVFASGRLDAGVHSLGLKAHFDVESKIDESKVANAINHFLPEDVSITEVKEVDLNFHARYSVKQKTYEYKLYVSEHRHALLDLNHKQLYFMPNVNKMVLASEHLLGKHDFSAFMSSGSSIKSTIRTIKSVEVKEENGIITLTICGDGFLYNMVRIIVGTLLNVGYDKISVDDFKVILNSGIRKNAGKMVEAKGLTLLQVEY